MYKYEVTYIVPEADADPGESWKGTSGVKVSPKKETVEADNYQVAGSMVVFVRQLKTANRTETVLAIPVGNLFLIRTLGGRTTIPDTSR